MNPKGEPSNQSAVRSCRVWFPLKPPSANLGRAPPPTSPFGSRRFGFDFFAPLYKKLALAHANIVFL